MSSRKFRFVSPGVFLREVDQSQLPAVAEAIGPVIIGRTRKGPALTPTKVRSLEDLETIFGAPLRGGETGDAWRNGQLQAEGYATYAAKAYLTAGAGTDSPVTIVRLLGIAGDNADSSDLANPGWKAAQAHGLFLMEDRDDLTSAKLELAAIIYSTTGSFQVRLKGPDIATGDEVTQAGKPVKFSQDGKLVLHLQDGSTAAEFTIEPQEIRKSELNTNPVLTNSHISDPPAASLADKYWLGESFEEAIKKFENAMSLRDGSTKAAVILELNSSMADFKGSNHGATTAVSGWVFGQDTGLNTGSFDPTSHQKLFRIHAVHQGSQASKELIIGIENIVPPRDGAQNRYGKFDVVVKRVSPNGVEIVDTFAECNLDQNSSNFISKKIGDQYQEWVPSEKRNRTVGINPVRQNGLIRVEVNSDILAQGAPSNLEAIPFGFFGPVRPATQTVQTAIVGQTAASAIMTLAGNGEGGNGENFTLSDGTDSVTFTIDTALAAGEAAGAADQVTWSTAGSYENIINSIIAAVALSDLDGKITAAAHPDNTGVAGDRVVFTQLASIGATGNTAIDPISAGLTSTFAGSGGAANAFDGGADGTLSTNPAFGETSWVSGTIDMAGVLDGAGESVTVQFPDSSLINTASSADGSRFLGFSPFKMSYGTNAAHGDNHSTDGNIPNPGMIDYLRILADHNDYTARQEDGGTDGNTEYAFTFSLDEVVLYPTNQIIANGGTVDTIGGESDVARIVYVPGSREGATDSATTPTKSWTWHKAKGQVSGSHNEALRTLLRIVNGFHMPLVGGNDGVDLTESDPFNPRVLLDGTTDTNYAYASVDRALELIKDPEVIEHNLAVMPGITEPSLTTKLVDLCEARADSLAIIDLPDIWKPRAQTRIADSQRGRGTTPEASARKLVERQINSSYGAAYYPWVVVQDGSARIHMPPSVVALGTMAYTERTSAVWFAPAGFNRGGLNVSGLSVPDVSERLKSKDRDTLYDAGINPIAMFAAVESPVVFGQKTLQSTQSALDRINVRRLLIHVKKIVSRISNNLLFEPNVQATWARFHGQVKKELDSIKVGLGLTDYKVVLDTTTTTPDLIDRNIMYAKIFLKPARAIEFIAVDFVITNTGAAYDD